MIESIRVTNFQSLHQVYLELGKFTVITGPSSSGKSALTRAMKAVTSNALSSDYITRGTKKSAVSLCTGDTTVTIERETGGSSVYKIASVGSEESRFARLNRQVPTEVTEALGISPGTQEVSSINFAGQFDTPYLLTEGASSVARVLGELTNVSTIFAAVKEASKRAKSASTLVNLRKKDETSLREELSKFPTLKQDAKAVIEAEAIMAECIKINDQLSLLQGVLSTAQAASDTLRAIKIIPQLPDSTSVLEAHKNLNGFKVILKSALVAKKAYETSESDVIKYQQQIKEAETQLHDLLVEARKCPTCNQDIL